MEYWGCYIQTEVCYYSELCWMYCIGMRLGNDPLLWSTWLRGVSLVIKRKNGSRTDWTKTRQTQELGMGPGCPNTAHSKTSYCLQDVTTPMSPLTTHGSWDQTDNTAHVTTTCIERSPRTLTLHEDNTTFQSILDYCDGHRLW